MPLDLVRRTLEEVFARRRERGAKGRIQSLRYCAPAVDAAWAEVRELTAPGVRTAAPPLDLAPRLAGLAAALAASCRRGRCGRRGSPRSPAIRRRSRRRSSASTATCSTEAAGQLGEAERERLAERAAASLAAVAGRLPEAEVEVATRRLERRLLRRELGLPVLSLFSPEAEADDPAG